MNNKKINFERSRVILKNNKNFGFSLLELIIVIVIIGILVTITAVSYLGMTNKAIEISLQSDLDGAKKKLVLYKSTYRSYPIALDSSNCPTAPTSDSNYCLKTSANNSFTEYTANRDSFSLTEANINGLTYTITDDTSPQQKISLAVSDPDNWIMIGSQTWAKYNLNVGTMISFAYNQSDDSVVQKYCAGNLESNCTTYGATYGWNEAMQYVTNEGAQGICPAGSHIPTDNEWKILEMYLGLTQVEADNLGWRGTDQGTQLKSGGSSGLNIPFAGVRVSGKYPGYVGLSLKAFLWSSTSPGDYPYFRGLEPGYNNVYRWYGVYDKNDGFSVRCIEN